MFKICCVFACALVAVLAPLCVAQTLSNPKVSAVGDMRFTGLASETADSLGLNQALFEFHELELNLNAYLNPYIRGDVYIGYHGEGVIDIEEASMTVLRGLPLSMQFKAGKYLLDFGLLNQQHPHQWAWLEFPLMIRTMLAPEGLRTVGGQISTLQALGDNALTLSLNAFSSIAFAHEHGEASHVLEEEAAPEIMYSGRLSSFRQFGDSWSGQAAVSALYGTYDPVEALDTRIGDFDLKLHWRPSDYKSIVFVFESMYSDRDVAVEDTSGTSPPSVTRVKAAGLFTSVDLQFRKRWDGGGYYDYSQDATIADVSATAWGLFFGFSPSEETARFSLVYRNEVSDLYDFTDNQLTFQVLWALGPHQPHRF